MMGWGLTIWAGSEGYMVTKAYDPARRHEDPGSTTWHFTTLLEATDFITSEARKERDRREARG
jgi:hypothetical protein